MVNRFDGVHQRQTIDCSCLDCYMEMNYFSGLWEGVMWSINSVCPGLRNKHVFWKRWEYQTTWLASWETYMQVRKQQLQLDMEQQTGSK